ncbi:hypothetical protein [Leucobacter chromiireducens]|uniref:Uncharacterized protein n=1 Tax=Leucobacter chromiireducens subsp. solipictus TaxID=398235 RepID=A0ABS1SDX3_9MICO|nr:hypothetical protein [Leucobacter chromiireducens]MBL3678532.1 hypothetical protein [Leucobacter chromiireducens subsp. solipictus]
MTSGTKRASRRRPGALIAILIAVAVLIGGALIVWAQFTDTSEPRFLTTEESQSLAVSRFNNFTEGTREITLRVAAPNGDLVGEGFFDYASGTGIARLTRADGGRESEGEDRSTPVSLVWWNYEIMGELRSDEPLPNLDDMSELVDRDDWRFATREQVAESPLGALLVLTAGYGFDRPDNPKLIEQSDAVWLGTSDQVPGGEGTWAQLPSADQVREPGSRPANNAALPRVLFDADGTVWQARIGAEGSRFSVLSYGQTRQMSVPSIPSEVFELPAAGTEFGVGATDDGLPGAPAADSEAATGGRSQEEPR